MMTPGKDLRISESTGRFIDILRRYHELYGDVCSAVGLAFDESNSDAIIESSFYKEYEALEARLKNLTMQCIMANIENEDSDEI